MFGQILEPLLLVLAAGIGALLNWRILPRV